MSIKFLLSSLSKETRTKISNELKVINSIDTREVYHPYIIVNSSSSSKRKSSNDSHNIHLPFSYALRNNYGNQEIKQEAPSKKLLFTKSLRDGQKLVKNQALTKLNETQTLLLSAYPGFGKTCMGIYISTLIYNKIAKPVLIVIHRIILMDQWATAIKYFCPDATVHKIDTKNPYKPGSNFYIINGQNIKKYTDTEGFLDSIGLLIIDECHALMTNNIVDNLLTITPDYLIGLSATPYRPDDNNILIDRFFGTDPIYIPLYCPHRVFKIDTMFQPDVKYQPNGKVDWNSVLTSQGDCVQRNEFVIDIVVKNTDRYFLILCKRKSQAKYLLDRFGKIGIDTTFLFGTANRYDLKSRVLIATIQKVGLGFSHEKLNALIIAADLEEYFVQYLGRVFRVENSTPVIYDLVDDHPILKKHWNTRRKVYLDSGGELDTYKESVPQVNEEVGSFKVVPKTR